MATARTGALLCPTLNVVIAFHAIPATLRAPAGHLAGSLMRLLRDVCAASAPFMNSEKAIELEGKITSVLAGTMFRVQLSNDHVVLAHISGKMRKRFIRLTTGDRVKIEMSPYDIDKARIVYRLG